MKRKEERERAGEGEIRETCCREDHKNADSNQSSSVINVIIFSFDAHVDACNGCWLSVDTRKLVGIPRVRTASRRSFACECMFVQKCVCTHYKSRKKRGRKGEKQTERRSNNRVMRVSTIFFSLFSLHLLSSLSSLPAITDR